MRTSFPVEPLANLEATNGLDVPPEGFAELLTSIRRHLHQHPEVGLQEYETARFIRTTLEQHGLDVKGPLAETGLFVDIEGAQPGPHIGYRADIDALPTQDAKDVPYASQHEGVAHLCGHDAHAAVGIGVALLLHQLRSELHGTVRVFFQPNEESTPSGARLMIDAGILNDLETVYAIHVSPKLPVGTFGLRAGPMTAAADRFEVQVTTGSTGHSARPHEKGDPVWAATQVASTLYQLTGRIIDARNAAVITICQLRGSDAANVIPDTVTLGGTLRCIKSHDRKTLKKHMREVVRQTAARCGAQGRIGFDQSVPPVVNEARLVRNVETTIHALFGDEAVHPIRRPSMGAEDFAHYLKHVPGALVRVGISSSSATRFPLHDAHFDLDEAALGPAARLMTMVLRNHLCGPEPS